MAEVKVVVRFRPENELERATGGQPCVDIQDQDSLVLKSSRAAFTFDRVFDWSTTQEQLFDETAKPIVEDVLAGYNGTIFAYGQTSSGKTYTLYGPSIDDAEKRGVVPRIVHSFFDRMVSSPDSIEFTLKVAYMEIYLEKIRDLLDDTKENLQVHEDPAQGVYVKGVTEVYVASVEETMDILRQGSANRAVGHTRMNAESSRSHSVFVLTVSQRDTVRKNERVGKLYLIDLAGSEKVSKTNASGITLDEAKNINKSLSALGLVINSLTDGKSKHVPYRDSKLTRILQESLGGNSRTTVIINCSPSSYNEAETLSSLRFGARAKAVKNKARVNVRLSVEELMKKLAHAERELRMLRQGGQGGQEGAGAGGEVVGMRMAESAADAERLTAVEAERDELAARLAAVEEENKHLVRKMEDVRRASADVEVERQEKAALLEQVRELMRERDAAVREAEQSRMAADELRAQLEAMHTAAANASARAAESPPPLLLSAPSSQGTVVASEDHSQVSDMARLVKGLSMLGMLHKQLVEQNEMLKVEAAVNEQKLRARSERIDKLEKAMRTSEEVSYQTVLEAKLRIISLEATVNQLRQRIAEGEPTREKPLHIVKHIKGQART